MPTVVEERGFRIAVYTRDHILPHVHVSKAGGMARFVVWNDRGSLYENHGLTERELQTAGQLCVKHHGAIVRTRKEMPWVT